MSANDDYRLIPEHELKKRVDVIKHLNRQRNTDDVLEAIRQKQLPVYLASQHVDLEDLKLSDKDNILKHWSRRDYEHRLLDAVERMAEASEKQLLETRIKSTRKGRIFGNRFVLPASNPLVKIDLVNPQNSTGLPAGVALDFPRVPLAKMKIYNEGPSPARLLISTNEGSDSTKAQASIPPNDSYTFDTHEPVLEYLNLVATADLTLNILAEI